MLATIHEYLVRRPVRDSRLLLTYFNRGLTNSFAIFETYYTHTLLPQTPPSSIAWIGSIQLFLTLFVGVFAGWLLDTGHVRLVVVVGIIFEVIGMLLTSFCQQYWQLLLAQGFCVGVGSGALAFTSTAIIPFYFTKWRMLAAGAVSTGSSVGRFCVQRLDLYTDFNSSGSDIPIDDAGALQESWVWLGYTDSSFHNVDRSVTQLVPA